MISKAGLNAMEKRKICALSRSRIPILLSANPQPIICAALSLLVKPIYDYTYYSAAEDNIKMEHREICMIRSGLNSTSYGFA
jgi:hypothetical protein